MKRAADLCCAGALCVAAALFSELSGRPALAAGSGLAVLVAALLPWRVRGPSALRSGVGLALGAAGVAVALLGTPDGRAAGYVPVGGPLAAAVLMGLWVGAWRLLLHAPWGRHGATLGLGVVALMALGAAPPWTGYSLGVLAFGLLGLAAMRLGDPDRPSRIVPDRRTLSVAVALLVLSIGLAFGMSQALYPLNRWAVDQMISAWRDRTSARTGFSEQLTLGSLNGMLNSDAVALRVRGAPPGHLRATVYQGYKGGRWLPPGPAPPKTLRVPTLVGATAGSADELQVLVDTGGRYPLALGLAPVGAPGGQVVLDSMGVVRAPLRESPTRIAFAPGDAPAPRSPVLADLQVPDDVRAALAPEARRWVGDRRGRAALEILAGRFQRDFSYSLEHRRRTRLDPAVDFVLHHRVGHCECFASAMALMARSLDIPARLVGGYLGGERSALGGWHLVRQRNAHAWVEAWTGDRWRTFDPTPPGDVATTVAPHAGVLSSLWHLLAAELAGRWESLTTRDFLLLALALGVFLAFFLLIPRWWRGRRSRKRRAVSAAEGPLPCYGRLEQALARAGSPRAPGETLSGYADRLDAANSRHGHGPDTGDVIRTYAALRYGGMGDPAAVIAAVEGAARQGS